MGVPYGVIAQEDGCYGELPIPYRIGYIFDGWYLGETLISTDGSVPITEDCTLVAHWTPITYTVVYHGNGGNAGGQTEVIRTYSGRRNHYLWHAQLHAGRQF